MTLAVKSKMLNITQRGFTLIELMISILIGLIILAAVVSMFVSMVKVDNDYLKSIRLNQELRAAMNLIARDIRRAGIDGLGATRPAGGPYPFSTSTTRLTVDSNVQGDANACIRFAYDEDNDGVDDGNTERYGYRWDSAEGAIEIRKSGIACNVTGWENITDDTLIEIFSETIGGTTHPGVEFVETVVIENGMYIRQIDITIRGRLRRDNAVARRITDTVKIRNEDTGP